jgi:hypothetical protein
VLSVDFAADGGSVVTASYDQTAKIWKAAQPEQVARWQKEDQAAARKLEDLHVAWLSEKERAQALRASDAGRIKRWLVLAPIPLASGQSGAEGLDVEQIPGEASLRPIAGDTVSAASGELRWREATLDQDYKIDFHKIIGSEPTQCVAFAACYIRSDTQHRGLEMLVGSDDHCKVYLNGKLVHKHTGGRPLALDEDAVPDVTLSAGLNVVVFKVVNESMGWQGSIRFTDAAGDPVRGIKVRLSP